MNEKMRIAVIDGQGGGIGKVIVEKLRTSDLPGVTILALGTNSAATMQMKKQVPMKAQQEKTPSFTIWIRWI